jgi:hypothetical protein
MRERAFVHVAGLLGSGKTTFIEAILKSVDGPVLAARCIRDDALQRIFEQNADCLSDCLSLANWYGVKVQRNVTGYNRLKALFMAAEALVQAWLSDLARRAALKGSGWMGPS